MEEAETWISQDSKLRVLRVRRAKENFGVPPKEGLGVPLGVPPKPASWGKLPQLSPDECPPKKRGRRGRCPPKAKEAGNTSTPTEDAAASKPRSKRSRPSNANGSDEARPTPAQRLRSYLDGLPNKRKAETTEVEANPPACKKRRTRKPKEDEPESTRSKKGRSKDNSKDEGKSKGSKVMTKEQAEKRAKASHKSSAYHVAYRATEGTVEEKAAAKKVAKLHLMHFHACAIL